MNNDQDYSGKGKGGILSFDIGNSCIKWALWSTSKDCLDDASKGEIIEAGSVLSSVSSLRTLMQQLSNSYQKLEKILAVNVAGEAIECALINSVEQAWEKEVQFLRTGACFSGRERTLTHAYSDPEFHGADRWAGLIAASYEFSGALCVISAGTAITFDLLEVDGRHLGGRILPSLQTMEKALLADAAAIDVTHERESQAVKDVPVLFANDTQGAISSGVYYLLAAGLREACAQAGEVLSQQLTFIVTGGGAEQLMQWVKVPDMKHRPNLILQGVYIALNKGEVNE